MVSFIHSTAIVVSNPSTERIADVRSVLLNPPVVTEAGVRYLIGDADSGNTRTGTPTNDWAGKLGQIAISDGTGAWTYEDQSNYPEEQLVYVEDSNSIWSFQKDDTNGNVFILSTELKKYLKVLDTIDITVTSYGSTFRSNINNIVFYDDNGAVFNMDDWRVVQYTRDGTVHEGNWPVTTSFGYPRNASGVITFEYIGETVEAGISRITHGGDTTRVFRIAVNYKDDTPKETRELGAVNVFDKSFAAIGFLALEGGGIHVDDDTIKTIQAGIGTDIEIGDYRAPKNVHINSAANIVSWNVDNSADGEYHYVMNVGADDHVVLLAGVTLAGAFVRNGEANDAVTANQVPIKAGDSWLFHVTDNNGNRFVNAAKLGGGETVDATVLEDTAEYYNGSFENQDGVNKYVWTETAQAGTAIAVSADKKTFTLAEGYTYEVRYSIVAGRSNSQFVNVGAYLNDVLDRRFIAVSDDDTNWGSGSGYQRIIEVPLGAAPVELYFKRESSNGNGNHDAQIIVKAIAKNTKTKTADIISYYPITSNGAALSPAAKGLNGQVTTVLIPVTTAGKSIQLEQTSIGAGHTVIYPGHGPGKPAIVAVMVDNGPVDIVWSEADVLATYNGIQAVDDYTFDPVYVMTTALTGNQVTGIDFTNADYFSLTIEDTTDTHTYTQWYDLRGGKEKFWFWGYSGETSHAEIYIKDKSTGTFDFRRGGTRNLKVQRISAYALAENGYVIPTGTQVATMRTVTHNGTAFTPAKQIPEGTTSIVPIEIATAGKALAVTPTAEYTLIDAGYGGERPALVGVSMGAADVDILSTERDVIKTENALHKIGEHRPSPPVDIDNTTLVTGIDLNEAELLYVTFSDINEAARCHTTWLDIRDGKNGHYYWNHDNAYITITLSDRVTGAINFVDSTRNARVVSVEGFKYADLQYVVPDTHRALETITLTVTGGTLFNGSTTIDIYAELAAEIIVAVPTGEWIDPDTPPTITSGNVVVKDHKLGILSVTCDADATLTYSTVTMPYSREKLVLEGGLQMNYNNHSGNTDLTAFTKIIDETNSATTFTLGTDGWVTINKDMLLSVGLLVSASEGPGLQVWPRLQLDPVGNRGAIVISEDNWSNNSGNNKWRCQATRAVTVGDRLRFDGRVGANYPGERNCKIYLCEV